jgi:hypothetical protein
MLGERHWRLNIFDFRDRVAVGMVQPVAVSFAQVRDCQEILLPHKHRHVKLSDLLQVGRGFLALDILISDELFRDVIELPHYELLREWHYLVSLDIDIVAGEERDTTFIDFDVL